MSRFLVCEFNQFKFPVYRICFGDCIIRGWGREGRDTMYVKIVRS